MKRTSITSSNFWPLTGCQLGSYCARPGADFAALGHEEKDLGIPAEEVNEQRG
ncbi:hypothetical protein EI77_02287 [Prosthecobacter fusiformis]|uniref:Uncharacterized protein n=1 Tax=Prosthecobacter fusiformis TaxID=48464 RepID=A0A4R7S1S2_9BACT|nr:hypothetical protein EI77_02287 [Prosthecobacter fusiformis]